MVESSTNYHFVVPEAQKKFDTPDQAREAWVAAAQPLELSDAITRAHKITISGNSYSIEACEWLAQELAKHDTPHLTAIDFSSIFVQRLRSEIPRCLELMMPALLPK
jgi:Ran GTPase-activating protein (RanGAP) involved in mRNA processing and transport